MPLDVLEHADPLDRRRGSEVRPQEPQAGDPLLVHQAVDLSGQRDVVWSARTHLARMIRRTRW